MLRNVSRKCTRLRRERSKKLATVANERSENFAPVDLKGTRRTTFPPFGLLRGHVL